MNYYLLTACHRLIKITIKVIIMVNAHITSILMGIFAPELFINNKLYKTDVKLIPIINIPAKLYDNTLLLFVLPFSFNLPFPYAPARFVAHATTSKDNKLLIYSSALKLHAATNYKSIMIQITIN